LKSVCPSITFNHHLLLLTLAGLKVGKPKTGQNKLYFLHPLISIGKLAGMEGLPGGESMPGVPKNLIHLPA
jgi:hypothetical protein